MIHVQQSHNQQAVQAGGSGKGRKKMKAIVAGRHDALVGPNVEVVRVESVSFPATHNECAPVVRRLLDEAAEAGAVLIFQGVPAQVSRVLSDMRAADAYEAGLGGGGWNPEQPPVTGWRVYQTVASPGPRPGKIVAKFGFTSEYDDMNVGAEAGTFANPRAKVTVEEATITVEVDGPPTPFVFSHLEPLL